MSPSQGWGFFCLLCVLFYPLHCFIACIIGVQQIFVEWVILYKRTPHNILKQKVARKGRIWRTSVFVIAKTFVPGIFFLCESKYCLCAFFSNRQLIVQVPSLPVNLLKSFHIPHSELSCQVVLTKCSGQTAFHSQEPRARTIYFPGDFGPVSKEECKLYTQGTESHRKDLFLGFLGCIKTQHR